MPVPEGDPLVTTDNLKLAVIIGSTREGRLGPTVARWFVEQAERHGGMTIEVIDLAEADLPTVLPAFGAAPPPDHVRRLATVTPALAAADAFVVVTPEYNHSFPAALKNAIDWHNGQWHAKPVGFVSYGGVSAGLRAVEQLRLVFAELHAVTIRDTVSFSLASNPFDAEGQPRDPETCLRAAKTMLDQLVWWAAALHRARVSHPYRP
jgi:NAD(P)H-dependent FMN reductase